ncbi:MAG: replication-associated recombination protein A [Oligoflexia bacterium]|nr:replication-associated recombination protein A [Oligoflexia bacterium]
MQFELFASEQSTNQSTKINNGSSVETQNNSPLAFSTRPISSSEFIGYDNLLKNFPFLKFKKLPSFVVFGPPGTGKTTLAHMIARERGLQFYPFSAVLGSVVELKKIMDEAKLQTLRTSHSPLIFIDEIHRFNKTQQDALLLGVEEGNFILIGATTENPKYSLNRALISRLSFIELKKFSQDDLINILQNVVTKQQHQQQHQHPLDVLRFIAESADGDARRAINFLEIIYQKYGMVNVSEGVDLNEIKSTILKNNRTYDKDQNRHYDVISAFIKSMRGSDPQSALLWLAIMLDGGEDPLFIARRMIIFASEDVGNADPMGLVLAIATLEAVKNIGMPEVRINLAQTVTYLASTVKSNASYVGINEAMKFVEERSTIEVPMNIKTHPNGYQYPHDHKEHFIKQNYNGLSSSALNVEKLPNFYRPTEIGREKFLKERLEKLWS